MHPLDSILARIELDFTMTQRTSSPLFWGFAALAISVVIAALVGSVAVRDLRRAGNEITVTGSARRPIRADFAVWRAQVTSQRPSLADAYKDVTTQAERVRAFLTSQGFADTAIVMRPLETFTIPEVVDGGRETGRTAGYRLSQSFEIRSPDVDRITALARAMGTLVNEGVPVVTSPPEYLFVGMQQIRLAMLADATRDARARATEIAKSAGSAIGDVRSVRMGVFQITPRNSTEVSDYGVNDVSSIDKDITAVVRVSFALR
jgi:hypothetical protein